MSKKSKKRKQNNYACSTAVAVNLSENIVITAVAVNVFIDAMQICYRYYSVCEAKANGGV